MPLFKKRKVEVSQSKKNADNDDDSDSRVVTAKKQKISGAQTATSSTRAAGSHLEAVSDYTPSEKLANDSHEIPAEPESAKKPTTRFGPVKATAHIRSTMVTDYQPDVCKDYKQTGYCGFGDSCKFLHAREDYAAGWKLDKEWEEEQKNLKKGKLSASDSKSPAEGAIPFKCVICKNDYKSPIVTNCSHYFCESCFMKKYKKSPSCFICGQDTHGIAKPAKNLEALLKNQSRDDS